MSTLASATDESYLVRFWDIASYTGGEPTATAETSWGQIKGHLQYPILNYGGYK